MEKSSSIKNIGVALMLFHVKMGKIKKDATNPFFSKPGKEVKYASLSTILENIETPLQESGLVFSQFPDGDCLTSILIHPESGEYIQACYAIHAVPDYIKEKDNGVVVFRGETYRSPQAIGSAITYARRYALSAILGLNVDEDDDGNASSIPTNGAMKPNTNVETDARPWLTEKQFNQALDKINKGEEGVYEKINAAFRMKKEYRERLLTVTA